MITASFAGALPLKYITSIGLECSVFLLPNNTLANLRDPVLGAVYFVLRGIVDTFNVRRYKLIFAKWGCL